MTDNDIIKALECIVSGDIKCIDCQYHIDIIPHCRKKATEDAIDLINRQKEEIESLQKENNQFADIGKMHSEIRAEAIKEFVERLKKEVDFVDTTRKLKQTIDNLVKEMVGERE